MASLPFSSPSAAARDPICSSKDSAVDPSDTSGGKVYAGGAPALVPSSLSRSVGRHVGRLTDHYARVAERDQLYELGKNSPFYRVQPNMLRCDLCEVTFGHDVERHAHGKKHTRKMREYLKSSPAGQARFAGTAHGALCFTDAVAFGTMMEENRAAKEEEHAATEAKSRKRAWHEM